MRFLDRIRFQGAPKSPQEADSLALRHLAARGADLARPRHVIHFLYFAEESDARAAAAAAAEAAWTTTVEEPTETTERWCLQADGQRTVSPETVTAIRSWFETVAAEHHGDYDGWEAAAKP